MDEEQRLNHLRRRAFVNLVLMPPVGIAGMDVQTISADLYHSNHDALILLCVLAVLGLQCAYQCWIIFTSGFEYHRFWPAGNAAVLCWLPEWALLFLANHYVLAWVRLE